MAKILGIDFQLLGWNRKLFFTKVADTIFLSYASYSQQVIYKQPKKNIDLDLIMSFEWLASEIGLSITKRINYDDEWKKNNLMVNLPTAFDSSFWGGKAIISPTDSINAILQTISIKN